MICCIWLRFDPNVAKKAHNAAPGFPSLALKGSSISECFQGVGSCEADAN
jgi:hypothetical protein